MKTLIAILIVALSHMGQVASLHAEDEKPLHLVISKVGEGMALLKTDEGKVFALGAEIQRVLNFSLRGDFKIAEFLRGSTVAPDGKTYELKAIGEQPEAFAGSILRFLSVAYENAHTGFSIGNWNVSIDFKIDGVEYNYKADYVITFRKPNEGDLGNAEWTNRSAARQEIMDQEAAAPVSKPKAHKKPTPKSKPKHR